MYDSNIQAASVWSTISEYRIARTALLRYLQWRFAAYGQAAVNDIVVEVSKFQRLLSLSG